MEATAVNREQTSHLDVNGSYTAELCKEEPSLKLDALQLSSRDHLLENASRPILVRCPRTKCRSGNRCKQPVRNGHETQGRGVAEVLRCRRTPTNVLMHPVALFTILDHYLRRTEAQPRVIGTLLGVRTDTTVEVRSAFAVLHSENSEQVAVDMEYHRTMYELHHKVNSKEVIVGW